MNKKLIKLTENDLQKIVNESVKRIIKEANEIPNQDHINERIIDGLYKSGHISAELMQLMIDLLCGRPEGSVTVGHFLGAASKLCNK